VVGATGMLSVAGGRQPKIGWGLMNSQAEMNRVVSIVIAWPFLASIVVTLPRYHPSVHYVTLFRTLKDIMWHFRRFNEIDAPLWTEFIQKTS
jgi:hypothetical protein